MSDQAAIHQPGPIICREPEQASLPARGGEITPMAMISMAIEKDAGIEKIQQLMDLQERWEANQARKAFDAAISLARADIKPIVKKATVDFETSKGGRTHYKHETLDAIAEQIDPILSDHGLSYRFRSRQENGMLTVTCIVAHRDGHYEETALSGPPDSSGSKNAYQSVGSAATYLQRYTLKLALGLSAAKDDDAESAGQQESSRVPGAVDDTQVKAIMSALAGKGIPVEEFCRRFNIERLTQLGEDRFQIALNTINKATKRG